MTGFGSGTGLGRRGWHVAVSVVVSSFFLDWEGSCWDVGLTRWGEDGKVGERKGGGRKEKEGTPYRDHLLARQPPLLRFVESLFQSLGLVIAVCEGAAADGAMGFRGRSGSHLFSHYGI